MADQTISAPPEKGSAANKKERSPSFPFVTLTKALERARDVYIRAKRHEIRLPDLASAWEYGSKSSGAIQTAAALVAFGLLDHQGSGDARKFKVSDLAFKALEDQRPGEREKALSEAALKPKLVSEYADKWHDGRPVDSICISELRIDRGFTEDGAKAFLRVFDDSMSFVKGGSFQLTPDKLPDSSPRDALKPGDLIQWTSGGVDQFPKPATVVGTSDDGDWVWVAESKTGVPSSEVQLVVASKQDDPVNLQKSTAPPAGTFASVSLTPFGHREEKFALAEGDVVIRYPSDMSSDSVSDLEDYLAVFMKKARRAANRATDQ